MRKKNTELMLRIKEYIEDYFESNSSTPTMEDIYVSSLRVQGVVTHVIKST